MINNLLSNITTRKALYLIALGVIIPLVVVIFAFLMFDRDGADNISPTPTPQPFSENTLPAPQIKSPANLNTNSLGDITFSFGDVTFPTSSKIIYSSTEPLSPRENERIALDLGFITDPEIRPSTYGNISIYRNGGRTLSFYPDIGRLEYIETPATDSASFITSLSEAEAVAKDSLLNFSPYTNHLIPDSSGVYFYRSGGDLTVVESFDAADTISIPFTYEVEGNAIYGQYGEKATADVWVNKSGQAIKITIRNAEKVEREQAVQIISLDEAKSKILTGEGIISKIGEAYHATTAITNIETVNFTSVSLAFLRDSAQNVLSPIFVFEGDAATNTGQEEIVVYLSALD